MAYKVRMYCHPSFEFGSCDHIPNHPIILQETFTSLKEANFYGEKIAAQYNTDEIEWEVIDEIGEIVF